MNIGGKGSEVGVRQARFVLGIDTCGPTGSVALGSCNGSRLQIVEQIELEGRSYSATLMRAIADVLAHAAASVSTLGAIVVANGPGSFTGVRIGLSAAKGLAEPAQIPVAAVSRLAVLAGQAGVGSSALDAHRHEVFLRLGRPAAPPQDLLAGVAELAAIREEHGPIALCDDAAAALLSSACQTVKCVRVPAPTAADALQHWASIGARNAFVDLALLDGHYLRRSDAEIFGEPSPAHSA
jgi:tRNA threonylcarbamoyladenosine biosynthesis protein TsaB